MSVGSERPPPPRARCVSPVAAAVSCSTHTHSHRGNILVTHTRAYFTLLIWSQAHWYTWTAFALSLFSILFRWIVSILFHSIQLSISIFWCVLFYHILLFPVLTCAALFYVVLLNRILFYSVWLHSSLFSSKLFEYILFCWILLSSNIFYSICFNLQFGRISLCSVLFSTVMFCSAQFCSIEFCSVPSNDLLYYCELLRSVRGVCAIA